MPVVVSMISWKSGVGKTTLTLQLASGLAMRHDKRVLLIDIDAQCKLSVLAIGSGSYIDHTYRSQGVTLKTLFDAYFECGEVKPSDLILTKRVRMSDNRNFTHIGTILSHQELMLLDTRLASEKYAGTDELEANRFELGKRTILKKMIDAVGKDYDYVLIDCPSNMSAITRNALFASNYYTIVAVPDFLSTTGISALKDHMRQFDDECRTLCSSTGQHESYTETKCGGILFNLVEEYGSDPKEKHGHIMNSTVLRFGPDSGFVNYVIGGDGIATVERAKIPIFAYHVLPRSQQTVAKQAKYFGRVVDEFTKRMK